MKQREIKSGYGGPRSLDEQAKIERWRMARGIRRPLTALEIAVALAEPDDPTGAIMGEEHT